MTKTLDQLRATPAHLVCEHGAFQRSCYRCACLDNEALKARVASLERILGEQTQELESALCGEEWDPAKYVPTKTPEEIRAAGHAWANERANERDLKARVRELESLLSIACNELFGEVVARPYQIEKMRAWHRLYTTMKAK